MLKSTIHDHQCGFKAFSKKILPLLKDIKDNCWFFDTEILVRAQKEGLKVREFPVRWIDRKLSRVKFQEDVIKMGFSILRLWFDLVFKKFSK
jgi:hypothetical protein